MWDCTSEQWSQPGMLFPLEEGRLTLRDAECRRIINLFYDVYDVVSKRRRVAYNKEVEVLFRLISFPGTWLPPNS